LIIKLNCFVFYSYWVVYMNSMLLVDNNIETMKSVLRNEIKSANKVNMAVGYFFLSGFNEIKDVIKPEKSFMRVIIGDETTEATLNELRKGFYEKTLEVIDKMDETSLNYLSDFIRHGIITFKVFTKKKLHSKVYLFDKNDNNTFIVGSSNLTSSGISNNLEMNIYSDDPQLYRELEQWFNELWMQSEDFDETLMKIIEFKRRNPIIRIGEYLTPQELFKYIIWSYFNGELPKIEEERVLTIFQLLGYINAIEKLQKHNGVILADSVGLGKTFIALKVVYNFINRKTSLGYSSDIPRNVMIVTPAQILFQWRELLLSDYFFDKKQYQIREYKRGRMHIIEIYKDKTKLGEIALISHQGFAMFKQHEIKNLKFNDKYSLIVIDEAHRFRNQDTKRYKNAKLLKFKSNGEHNKFLLITATPIVNTIWDLYALLELFQEFTLTKIRMNIEKVDKKYIMDIRDLFRYYITLRKRAYNQIGDIYELRVVEEIIRNYIINEFIILRTRKYIMENFKDVVINGKSLRIEDPEVIPTDYSTTHFYSVYLTKISEIMDNVLKLNFTYAKLFTKGVIVITIGPEGDEEKITVSIDSVLKLLLFKRLESSIYAFEQTLSRMEEKMIKVYNFIDKYADKLQENATQILKIIENIENELTEDDVGEVIEDLIIENRKSDTIKTLLETLKEKGKEQILREIQNDIIILKHIRNEINDLKETKYYFRIDPKLSKLLQLLVTDLKNKKVIIFSQYKDTVEYLYHNIKSFFEEIGERRNVDYITGELNNKEKELKIKRFAPYANNSLTEAHVYGEIDVLVSTDAISEGVNLQDADAVINYDLPYNPMIIVQRVGRVSRIGNIKKVKVYNFIVPEELEKLIHLMEKLEEKIDTIAKLLAKEFYIISPDEEITIRTFGEKIKEISQKTLTQIEQMTINNLLLGTKDEKIVDEAKLLDEILDKYNLTEQDFDAIKHLDPEKTYYTIIGTGKLHAYYEVYINNNLFTRGIGVVEGNTIKPLPISSIEKLFISKPKHIDKQKLTQILQQVKSLNISLSTLREQLTPRQKKTGIIIQLISLLKDIASTRKLISGSNIERAKLEYVLNTLVVNEFSLSDRKEIKRVIQDYVIERNNKLIIRKGKEADLVNTLYKYFKTKNKFGQNEVKIKIRAWYY